MATQGEAAAAVAEGGLVVDDEVCTGDTFSIYMWTGKTLPKALEGSPPWGRHHCLGRVYPPDCNPDVRKSMGWTVVYPRDIPLHITFDF